MISPTAEYALRAIVALGQGDGDAMVTRKIAEITKVPPGYLSKILQILRKRGLVRSRRGLGGGFVLAKRPSEMTVLDVVNAVDPIKRIECCPLDLQARGQNLCSLHQKLDAATALIERAFAETTMADVLADTGRCPPLCQRRDV